MRSFGMANAAVRLVEPHQFGGAERRRVELDRARGTVHDEIGVMA